MKAHCSEHINHKRIVFQENRSKLTVLNPKQILVEKVEVDGCEITNGIRCDFFMQKAKENERDIEYYIELKGQDLEHALEQLKRTISELSKDAKKQKKVSFIICTRSPLSSTKIQNFRVQFKKKFNSSLIIKSSPYEYPLDQ